jgi:DNA polymerase-1
MLIDMEYIEKIEPVARIQLETFEKGIYKAIGKVINLNSPPQMQELFFGQLGLKPVKLNKPSKTTGERSSSLDQDALKIYAEQGVEMAILVQEWKKLSTLYNNYIVGIQKHIDPHGKIHTTFNQDVARTGRLSAKDPNVQQIPNPEKDKWGIRGAFVADSDDDELIVIDYEQLEMRLLAAASGEQGMIDIINSGRDIHMGNASMIFGMPYDDIVLAKKTDPDKLTPYMVECLLARSSAKQVGFAIIYGQGPAAVGAAIGVSKQVAAQKIAEFEATYPAAIDFKEEAIAETEATGYAFTIMGRRRNIPEILSHRRDERAEGERRAVNTQIQGSAADVCRMAQILIDISGIDERLGCIPKMQVHDELCIQAPKMHVKEAMAELVDWMEHPFPIDLPVPLAVSAGHGRSWLDAK